ncbi:MAG: response regulator [Bdellovibrionota bacterium]
MKKVFNWWKDLSVFKKLYGVVGVMALLIAIELFSMLFTMNILSAVRAFVGGEGLWSKAQKDSIQSLHRYAFSGDEKFYLKFQSDLTVNYGDRKARLELLKPDPDLEVVTAGFLQGNIHPNDIPGLIYLFRRFYKVSYIAEAIRIWTEADTKLEELVNAAGQLHSAVSGPVRNEVAVQSALNKVDEINKELTVLENDFSFVLGEGSRWLEGLLRYLLIFAVLIVESTGLYLTFSFSRNLGNNIKELTSVAEKVGTGDFSQTVPVRSNDEMGQLAKTINNMTKDLEKNIGYRQKAENENEIKSLFLANMSHEIRTPLGIILGLTEALKQPDLPVLEQRKFVDIIDRTGNELKQIVNDILDLSKVEAGHLDIEKSYFSLFHFMEDLTSALDTRAQKNDNSLVIKAADNLENMVYTDRYRLRQILTNILGNALKFTKNGIVKVEYGVKDNCLYFRISDTGIGISHEQARNLFQPFTQLDASMTRRFGGTGLGLFLSKRLAAELGGDIILEESIPGEGSTFRVTVETKPPANLLAFHEPNPVIDKVPFIFKNKKVLIVDDSPDNQTLLQYFFTKWGVPFDSAENGEVAVKLASQHEYDVILMDMHMPIMDGYEATKELRRRNFKKPIVALTAHAMKQDQIKFLAAGCNEHLSKPVDFDKLYGTLEKFLTV